MEELKNKTVLITGSSSGIGHATAAMLIDRGYDVIGLSRHFEKDDPILSHENFRPMICDVTSKSLSDTMKKIRAGYRVDYLILNAGVAYYGNHETLNEGEMEEIIDTDLLAPLIITKCFLPGLKAKGGRIIFISSETAVMNGSPKAAAYGAAKAGLLHFARSIALEAKNTALKVTTIIPDLTSTDLYRNADFIPDRKSGSSLDPFDVARAVISALEAGDDIVFPEIRISPAHPRIEKKTLR